MNNLSKTNTVLKLYAVVITLSFLLLAFYERVPQRIVRKFSHKETVQQVPEETEMTKMVKTHWALKTDLFNLLTTHDKIVFVGNSITEGGNWDELFQSSKIVNRGIGGDVSEGILKRIDHYLVDSPRCIVLMDGINDIMQNKPIDTLISNFQKIVAKIKAHDIPLIVQSTLLVAKGSLGQAAADSVNKKVKFYNTYLSSYCVKEGISYVDVIPVLQDNGYLRDDLTEDGVHIKGEAYLKWKAVLKPFLDKYL